MAPEADLIFVKSSIDTNPLELSTTNNVLDGIAYIQAKAKALGKPCVINLSLGSYYGSHDGTSNYERALDNASGAGKVIVSAAGNEADANIHASGTVAQGGSTTVGFTVPNASQEERIIIWYSGADQMGITVANGSDSSCTLSANPGETNPQETACGRITIASTDVNPLNGDRAILIIIANGTNPLSSGAWSYTLSGISISNGKFDAWSGETASNAQFTTNIDPSNTLTDSSTATKAIAVAAYNTKNAWDSLTGPQSSSFTLGDIASFSSRGPRRSCSDTSKCPSVQKPEITALGNLIMSALSANSDYNSTKPTRIDADGVHIALEGTSMATPHVAGAVALLLEVAPTLTSDEIKSILTSNTKAEDSYTGTLPNDTWGYGKMDVAAAYAATPQNLTPAVPTDVTATAGAGQVTITWSPALGAASYNIYWSTTSGVTTTGGTKIANATSPYVHTGLSNGTAYYYVVTAANANGESAESSQVNATTTGASSGGGSSGDGGGGGCFIATAAYGSYLDPHVLVLKEFRDSYLLTNAPGQAFVSFYYKVSPPIADFIREHETLRAVTRLTLTPVVYGVKYPMGTFMFVGFVTGLIAYRRKR